MTYSSEVSGHAVQTSVIVSQSKLNWIATFFVINIQFSTLVRLLDAKVVA